MKRRGRVKRARPTARDDLSSTTSTTRTPANTCLARAGGALVIMALPFLYPLPDYLTKDWVPKL